MPAEAAVPAEIPLQAPAEAPVEERTEIPAEAVEGTVGAPVVEPTVDPIGEIPAEAVATVSEPSDATDSEGAPGRRRGSRRRCRAAEPFRTRSRGCETRQAPRRPVALRRYGLRDSGARGRSSRAAEERPVPPPQAVPAVSPSSADVPQEEPAATSVPVGGAGHRAVPAENGAAVLGETLNSDVKTVSDLIAVTTPPAAVGQEPVADLRQALCNNDRFLLALRPLRRRYGCLRADDRPAQRVRRSGRVHDLHRENFDWNPNSDGAKLLVDLIERKLA